MVFVFKDKLKGKIHQKIVFLSLVVVTVLFAVLVFVKGRWTVFTDESVEVSGTNTSVQVTGAWTADDAVWEVVDAYGVPRSLSGKLIEFLARQHFNDKYGGVGLFSVRPSHADWIKGKILQDTDINLEDPLQNTQVAMFLLSGFHASGYSWGSSALIYCYGFPAIHEREKYQDFLGFIGDGYGE
jgi:hypothetical protein